MRMQLFMQKITPGITVKEAGKRVPGEKKQGLP